MGTLTLALSASDPQGQAILISGTLNGDNFTCPAGAGSCSIPITTESSTGSVTYRVDSATGLNATGAASYKLDATTPALNGSISGVVGTNNWYRSNVNLTVSSNDALSGIASTTASINGGAATAINGPLSFSDGVSSVILTATDNAGNVTQITQTIQVDTVTPTLNTTLSGTSGSNSWYVSTVSITPSANDTGSGLANLEVNIDGNGYIAYTTPITFSDGVHTYQFRATDYAGNVTETVRKTVKVDTTTPSVSLNINGTKGTNGWYISNVTVETTVSDATSTVSSVQASADGGAWTTASQLSFSDGPHTYQFKVTDQAGNSTTIPVQNLKIDTIAPAIAMTEELSLGETLYYSLEDNGSGLAIYRAVIEDEDERYQKVVWTDAIGGNKLKDTILWDGKFKDGTKAGWGEYYITLKISDAAGNETMQSASVTVDFFSFLQEIPDFTPPLGEPLTLITQVDEAEQITQFGGENSDTGNGETVTTDEGGAGIVWPEGTVGEVQFNVDSTTTTNTSPLNPNILWGVAATALAGATLAEWQRQREEEARKRQEAEAAKAQKRANTERRRALAEAEAAIRQRWAWEKAEEQYLKNYNEHMEEKMEQFEAADDARWEASQQVARPDNTIHANVSANAGTSLPNRTPTLWNNISSATEALTTSAINWTTANIVEPIKEAVYVPFIQPLIEDIQHSPVYTNIQNVLAPKNIVPTLMTVALGVHTVQWINNITGDSNFFNEASQNAQEQWDLFRDIYPKTEENSQLTYLFTNPYEIVQIGYEATKTFADIVADYADTVLQANPLNQFAVNVLQDLGDHCPEGFGEDWARRCSAISYFAADVIEHPMDTFVGVGTALVADPTAGAIKTAAYIYENLNLYELTTDIAQIGLADTIQDRIDDIGSLVSDPAVQAFLLLAGFTLAAIVGLGMPALILGGGMVLGQTANLIEQIDTELQAAPSREDAMEVVTNPHIRKQIVTSAVLLAFLIYGGARSMQEVTRINAFQQTVSPSAQEAFLNLSFINQLKLLNNAETLGTSLSGVDFYLTESARPNSPLNNLAIRDALFVSDLASQSGKGMLLIDYIGRYGFTDALRISTPEIINGMVNDSILVQTDGMLNQNFGYNISPEVWFHRYPEIGRYGTYITNKEAVQIMIGEFEGKGVIQLSKADADALAIALGLDPNTLTSGFRISKITGLDNMNLSFPIEGNDYFLGPGMGLPGGGPELKISPPISIDSPYIIEQIIVEIKP